jgi:hypothetical protein
MMADTGTGRILPTEVISPIQSYDRGAGSLHEDAGALRPEPTLSAGQGVRKKGRGKQESAQPEMIVVVEQWICLVLGLVCMGFEMWGICRKPEQHAPSAHIAWLGSLSTPTLRVTAVVCIGLGAVLARRGWADLSPPFDFQRPENHQRSVSRIQH